MAKKRTKIILTAILAFAAITRWWRVWEPREYYFDEVYHAYTAAFYAANDPAGYEWWHTTPQGVAIEWLHPPISKLFMGFSIFLLGDNSFAWRLPSVVFGVLVVWAAYWLAQVLTGKRSVGLVAALLASFEGLLLTQSRIAMNDIYVAFFILMALGAYWRYQQSMQDAPERRGWWLLAAGILAGFAAATKWSGVFVLGIFGIWEVVELVRNPRGLRLKEAGQKLLAFGLIPIWIYLLSFSQWWLQGHSWSQFQELHRQIWWYQTNLEATHPWQSQPWQWVLNIKPVWFWVGYEGASEGNIYALANPVIAWVGVLAMGYVGYRGWKKKERHLGYLVVAYLLLWTPWVVSPRIMFFYHYTPAMALLAIALAMWVSDLEQNRDRRWLGRLVLGMSLLAFLGLYPFWTGMLLPKEWVGLYKGVYEWPERIGLISSLSN